MGGANWLSVQWHPEYDWRENFYSKMVLARFGEMIGLKPVTAKEVKPEPTEEIK